MYFYSCSVEWSQSETSSLRNFWAWALDIGEALDKVQKCAVKEGISNPIVRYIDYYDFDDLPETVFSNDEGETFVDNEIYTFPIEHCYRLPFGIILSFEEGEYEDTSIRLGYSIITLENKLIEVEAVVEEHDLLPIYLDLVQVLPTIRAFWIKLSDDWEDKGEEEIYVNDEINSLEQIKRYIEENKIDTLLNGHLTVTTYSDEGQTNVNISDHKTLIVMTYNKKLSQKFSDVFKKYELKRKAKLISVAGGFHHYHYKHPKGLNRENLIEKLKEQSFNYWNNAVSETENEQC